MGRIGAHASATFGARLMTSWFRVEVFYKVMGVIEGSYFLDFVETSFNLAD